MPAQEILQLGNPILWERSLPIENVATPATRDLARDLGDTLADFRAANGFGRGIAAPQIGALRRMIFVRMQPVGFCGPIINPRIVWESPERFEMWDDCFSFPGLMVRVERATHVHVEFQDEHGSRQLLEAEGGLSELLQHEIDHLDGILALDRAVSPRAWATRDEWERNLRR